MNSYGEFPSPRDPFDSGPRFDLFGAFAFLSVLILFGAMYVGLYAGPFVQTSRFELPDIFGTKAQEQAQKLLISVAIPNQPAPSEAEPTAVAGPKTIVPVVPGEAAEAAITIPFGIGAQPGAAPAAAAPTAAAPAVAAEPAPIPQVSEHAVGSRHKVVNTNGDGVFVRRAPGSNDKIRAWPDSTVMEFQGELVDLQGAGWAKMKDPAGNIGWVPVQYLTPYSGPAPAAPARPAAQPAAPPAAPAAPASAPAGIQTVPVAPAQPPAAGPPAPAPAPAGIVTQPIARPAAPRR
jgi:hypothetical protein